MLRAQLKDVVLRKLRPANAANVIIERLLPRRGVTPSLDWLSCLNTQGVSLPTPLPFPLSWAAFGLLVCWLFAECDCLSQPLFDSPY